MTETEKKYSRYFTYIQPVIKAPVVRTYATPIFTIVVITIFILFAIKPTIETMVVLQKQLDNSTEVLNKVTQKSQNLSQAKKNYQNLDPTVKDTINSTIPAKFDIKSLVGSLQQSALVNQASVSALQIQPLTLKESSPSSKINLEEISFTYNVVGNYQNLISTLESLKQNGRLISIDSVVVTKSDADNSLIMSVSGKAYFLK